VADAPTGVWTVFYSGWLECQKILSSFILHFPGPLSRWTELQYQPLPARMWGARDFFLFCIGRVICTNLLARLVSLLSASLANSASSSFACFCLSSSETADTLSWTIFSLPTIPLRAANRHGEATCYHSFSWWPGRQGTRTRQLFSVWISSRHPGWNQEVPRGPLLGLARTFSGPVVGPRAQKMDADQRRAS
jgi:hypothetical protein